LRDFSGEKQHLRSMQRAIMDVLEDAQTDKQKLKVPLPPGLTQTVKTQYAVR
jgi:hypothetical protein